jgi:DNA polymerase-3 subunit gamma/tau
MTLDKAYRPQSFDGVIGNQAAVNAIKDALKRPSGYPATTLLYGPAGCGKTTLARIIARTLDSTRAGLKELNISDMRGIDAARMIIELVRVPPWQGTCRVIILNECHKATNEFQNAMLEVLEEPPNGTYFILCTTEPEKLLKSVKNRCTHFAIKSVQARSIHTLLTSIAKKEGIVLKKDLIAKIAHAAQGSVRQALLILDTVLDIADDKEKMDVIMGYQSDEASLFELYLALSHKKPWNVCIPLLKAVDIKSAENARYALLALLERDIFAGGKKGDRAAVMMDFFTSSFQFTGRAGLTQACYLALKA